MTLLDRPAPTRRPVARQSRRRVAPNSTVLNSLDWWLLGSVAALCVIGCLLVWSATQHRDDLTGGATHAYLVKQAVNVAIGSVLGGIIAATDHRWLRLWAPIVYVGSLVGLLAIFTPLGAVINGSHSWLLIGGMSVQPAELAKLGVIIGMALVLAERLEAGRRTRPSDADMLPVLAIAAVPALLVLAQPDLGTLMVLVATVFGVVALSGAPRRWLAGLVLAAVGVVTLAILTGLLESYQLDRFRAFTDPSLDPQGAGYNTIQARIAIGNGGQFGQGLFDGSQTQSGFVPEQHTDFVFTVAGEEFGLLGAGVVIALFAVLLWRALLIARRAPDVFGRLAAVGVICWFGFQAFQNIGMCLGIMPVTGVPLPLVSYGGTSMFASLMAVGLLLNVHLRAERSLGLGPARTRRPAARW